MGNKIIAILAVHNEEKTLPFILKPLEACVDRIVAVIDNCSDQSEKVIKRLSTKTICVYLRKHIWRNFRAETKFFGVLAARKLYGNQCYLLMVDCDMIVDHCSVDKAKNLLDASDVDAVVFTYNQYSLAGSFVSRLKDEILNLFGKTTKSFTQQPVKTGTYLIRANKASMGDVTSDYETILPKLRTAWVFTRFQHLRPRYDKHTQFLMGVSRATLKDYNLLKILFYSMCTLSPYLASGFLSAKIRGVKTVENGTY